MQCFLFCVLFLPWESCRFLVIAGGSGLGGGAVPEVEGLTPLFELAAAAEVEGLDSIADPEGFWGGGGSLLGGVFFSDEGGMGLLPIQKEYQKSKSPLSKGLSDPKHQID